MRDLYNRNVKLEYWLKRVDTQLHGTDKFDVLKLVEHMQDSEKAKLWIIRCISALISIREQLRKPFKDATKDDIRLILNWMEDEKKYKASTNEKFRQILKLFYKIIYGNGEHYPEAVKWFPTRLAKEKRGKESAMELTKYLEESEVIKLVEAAPNLQKKAFLACLYETGARPEEFLRLTCSDIRIETNGIAVILRGKTGERRGKIIGYSSLLMQWLEVHPLKNEKDFPLWISESTNCKNKPLGLRGAEKIVEIVLSRAGIQNKKHSLYLLRHSRATHLANHLTEAQMCVHFGWVFGSSVVRRYIHLSGRDLDSVLISLNNSGNSKQAIDEYKIKSTKCIRCEADIAPSNSFCGKCGLTKNLQHAYLKEMDLEEKNKFLESKIDTIEKSMNERLRQIILMIQQNPKLTLVKTDVLLEKL